MSAYPRSARGATVLDPPDPAARRRDDHLQRRRGGRRADRGHARVSSAALIGFGLDSVIEVSSAAAVAWQFSGQGPRSAREDRAAVHRVLVLRARRLRHRRRRPFAARLRRAAALTDRHRAGRGQPGRHAGAVVGAAPRRPRARLAVGGRRFQADAAVHLPVRGAAGRTGAQQPVSAGHGPTRRRAGHRRGRGAEGINAWRGDACCQ